MPKSPLLDDALLTDDELAEPTTLHPFFWLFVCGLSLLILAFLFKITFAFDEDILFLLGDFILLIAGTLAFAARAFHLRHRPNGLLNILFLLFLLGAFQQVFYFTGMDFFLLDYYAMHHLFAISSFLICIYHAKMIHASATKNIHSNFESKN